MKAEGAMNTEPARGWILYDGECPFCMKWVAFWRKTLLKRGFQPAPLQEAWVAERLKLPPEKLLFDLRLLTKDNTLISGADVYLHVARRIWWAWPLYAIFRLPGFNALLHRGYRWVATNRYCISRACKIK